MTSLINFFNRLRSKTTPYQYGYVFRDEDKHYHGNARKNLVTGEVGTLLWKPGEKGHKHGYWHRMGDGWDTHFHSWIEKD